MNIETIRGFVQQNVSSRGLVSVSKKEDKLNLVALKMLCSNDGWLNDQDLVKKVASRLESFACHSAPARAYAIAAYAKIIQQCPTSRASGRAESAQGAEDKTLATALALLRSLSKETTSEVLNHFVTYLTTGETDFIADENVVEVLLLAHEHHFEDLSLKCLMHVLNADPTLIRKMESSSSSQETELSNLLMLAQDGISAEVHKGSLSITIKEATQELLECLKKIHEFVPVRHLSIESEIHPVDLLDLVVWNPGLLSLSVRSEVSGGDLEKLSHNLSKLEKLILAGGTMTTLPEAISTRVKELHLSCCRELTEVYLPNAESIDFFDCDSLEMISIPKALDVNLLACGVTTLEIPSARRVSCQGCPLLKSINASAAEYFDCRSNPSLASINASSAEHLVCQATALIDIDAPCAQYMDCRSIPTLKSLSAPRATTLFYPHHQNFSTMHPPRILQWEGPAGWHYFPVETQKELFHAAYRGCIRSQKNIDAICSYMERLGHQLKNLWTPFENGYLKIASLPLPEKTTSEWEGGLASLVQELVSASEHHSPEALESVLRLLSKLKPLENPTQQISRLKWIGILLTSHILPETLFMDCEAILKAIGNLTDVSLQVKATNTLLSLYEGPPRRLSLWRALSTEKNPFQEGKIRGHQLLPCLFLMEMGIEKPTLEKFVAGLRHKIYKNSKRINSIAELLSFLIAFSKDPSSSLLARETVQLILDPTEQEKGETQKAYNRRLVAHRKLQKELVIACRSLFSLEKFDRVKRSPTAQDILDAREAVFREYFGFDISFDDLSETFKSTRFPNGIVTYAECLQSLEHNRDVVEALGRFIDGVMTGQFPDMRYDLSMNLHLEKIFANNPSLLEKWRAPLSIDLKASMPAGDSSAKWVGIECTEQWEDLLLAGTEVVGSCQDIEQGADSNKCLLAYALDGKNKVIIVRSVQGKIAARSVLRILWDKNRQQPVLFMEKIYTNANQPALHDLIKRGCRQKAKEMGLPLLCEKSSDAQLPRYAGAISSLGCDAAPYEHIDALNIAVSNGCFEIPDSRVLYDPSVK